MAQREGEQRRREGQRRREIVDGLSWSRKEGVVHVVRGEDN